MQSLKVVPEETRHYIRTLEREIKILTDTNKRLERRSEYLSEQLRIALMKRFLKTSESSHPSQGHLFCEEETGLPKESEENEEQTTVTSHKRKTSGRKALDGSIPRIETVIDISEEDKKCACGARLVKIGEEASERLEMIPSQVWVNRIVRPKYACHECEGSGDEEKPAVRTAAAPAQMIAGSISSASVLAHVFTAKYCDHLPFYRQQAGFKRIGVALSRQTMSNWQLEVYKRLMPLLALLKTELSHGQVLQLDETRMQVFGEEGRLDTQQSYMWLARGGPPERKVVWYEYHETRGGHNIKSLIEGFSGYVQTDGYEAYRSVFKGCKEIIHVGCMAHARRKFHEAYHASGKKGAAREALERIKVLYKIERELREANINDEEFLQQRRKRSEPALCSFHQWLTEKSSQVLPSSALGKAISYTLNHWNELIQYLDCAELTPDNNLCENAIRPFVLGRKNWLFSGSPKGAASSCALYSLIETAKAQKLNPYLYLKTIFERIPHLENSNDWEQLLPWNISF